MSSLAIVKDWALPGNTRFTTGEALTLGFAYFTIGFTVAVLHVTEGTSPLVMIGSVFLVNSVTPTLAYAAVTAAGGSTLSGIFSGWLVSTRFGLFTAAIAPRLWKSRKARAVAAHVGFDPNVAMAQREQSDVDARRVYVAASIWLCIPWWIGGTMGALIGDRIGDANQLGLDAVFPAALLAIIWPQLRNRQLLPIAIAAAGAALVLLEPAPGGVPVLVAAFAALLALRHPTTKTAL